MWRAAGKADFAQSAAIISRFDPHIREQLSRSEGKVLQWCIFFVWQNSQRAGRTLTYTSFSQIELGKRFGRSRWTVARALERLTAFGLIKSQRRRPKSDGSYETNLYWMTAKLTAILARILGAKRSGSPCSKPAPQEALSTLIRPGDSLGGVAARQDNEHQEEPPPWKPTMKLSELVRQLNPGRFTPKLAS